MEMDLGGTHQGEINVIAPVIALVHAQLLVHQRVLDLALICVAVVHPVALADVEVDAVRRAHTIVPDHAVDAVAVAPEVDKVQWNN